jgi:hypothetical protein
MPWTDEDRLRTEEHIAHALRYIEIQEPRIEEMQREGRGTGNAEELLRSLGQTLAVLTRHLVIIKADLE